ncbi:hypothetical protein D033_1862A, partial [Vibrio parahaemolyticus B-265]
MAGRDTCAKPR